MNGQGQDWDDLRLFLAVARAGSLAGAARMLGVTHSTVFRRIGAFEARLGARLFNRLPSGYALTAAGEEMRDSVLRIEEEIAALALKVTGQDQRPSGTIRITATDLLAVAPPYCHVPGRMAWNRNRGGGGGHDAGPGAARGGRGAEDRQSGAGNAGRATSWPTGLCRLRSCAHWRTGAGRSSPR